jgi:hypothetical protein
MSTAEWVLMILAAIFAVSAIIATLSESTLHELGTPLGVIAIILVVLVIIHQSLVAQQVR